MRVAELLITSVLLGAGLAMDAFSVSLADGLNEPRMSGRRMLGVAGTFAVFQFAMPLGGWVLVRTAVSAFGRLESFIPWIALILLLYIGGKMLLEGMRENRRLKRPAADEAAAVIGENQEPGQAQISGSILDAEKRRLGTADLMIQGVATSIDALSVGFAIERYSAAEAFSSSVIIGLVTLMICMLGIAAGKKAGTRLAGKASILGGLILIFIGIRIWAGGVL